MKTLVLSNSPFIDVTLTSKLSTLYPKIISVSLFNQYTLIIKYKHKDFTLYNSIFIPNLNTQDIPVFMNENKKNILIAPNLYNLTHYLTIYIINHLIFETKTHHYTSKSIILSVIAYISTTHNLVANSELFIFIEKLNTEELIKIYNKQSYCQP